MKVTDIVGRIENFGRVVISKEIRRTMRLREGDPLDTALTRFAEVRHLELCASDKGRLWGLFGEER